MKKLLAIIACCVVLFAFLPVAEAVQLPNYAQGTDVSQQVQSKGKAFTDLIAMIVAILAIIGILVGAIKFATGNGEAGKQWVVGAVIALLLDGSVYGIAQMALS